MTPTPSDDQDARRFEAVRSANRSETAEDYVEAIDDLVKQNGEARVRDLAALFGVSHVTVSRTVERLQRDGLVETEPYRSIELTRAGRRMAAASRERHAQVLALLLSLGIEPEVAEQDAEGIEHHVGPETLVAFERFVAARGEAPEGAPPATSAADPERFARVRQAHASEITEDYVEAISDLIAESGSARVVDLARRFGVSHATVSRTVGRLQRDGYVETEPYRPVTLTPSARSSPRTPGSGTRACCGSCSRSGSPGKRRRSTRRASSTTCPSGRSRPSTPSRIEARPPENRPGGIEKDVARS